MRSLRLVRKHAKQALKRSERGMEMLGREAKKIGMQGLRTAIGEAQRLPGLKRRRRRSPLPAIAGTIGGVLALTVGGVLLASQLGKQTPQLQRSLLSTPRFFNFRGHKVAYYEQGQGDPVVLVHGIYATASAFEMRELFVRLGSDHRVIAIDLLGFGASDRPDIEYRAELYIDLLIAFVREVVDAPVHLIASSLSAAFAASAAVRDPAALRSLVLVNPTGAVTLARHQMLLGRLVERLFRAPLIGQGLFNLLVSRPSLRYYNNKAYGDRSEVSRAVMEHGYQTAHQPGARFAAAAFVGRGLNLDLTPILPELPPKGVRALVLWTGETGFQDTERERAAFERLAPRLRMVTLEGHSSLPYDEKPARFVSLLRDFFRDSAPPEPSPQPPPVEDEPARGPGLSLLRADTMTETPAQMNHDGHTNSRG